MNFARINKLEKLLNNKGIDKVPKGWFTSSQYAEHKNICQRQASRIISNLIKKYPNKVEQKKFKIKVGQTGFPVIHYKFL